MAVFHIGGCILSRRWSGGIMKENCFSTTLNLHECSSFYQGKVGMNLILRELVFNI